MYFLTLGNAFWLTKTDFRRLENPFLPKETDFRTPGNAF
jgi:hypothetical protein